MEISEKDKSILHNVFNKVGLEGSSEEEVKYYIKNIYLYKEPKKIVQNINKQDTEEADKTPVQKYIIPEKLSFKTNLSNNARINIINSIGENINDTNDNENNNYEETEIKDKIFKDKLSFNTKISKEKLHGIFTAIG